MAIIAHVDMDCFFCACEEKYKPHLKGTPVIVGGICERGVVCASNYEARKYGVFSAMPGSVAKRRCPNGNFLSPDMQLYKKESDKIMKILSTFSSKVIQASIDEAYLDLTEFFKQFLTLREMGMYIKNKIKEETNLNCSIGIAQCKITAKIASDYKKPNGCTIVKDQKKFLALLDVRKIPGIGKKSVTRYYSKRIFTCDDLAKADSSTLIKIGGERALKYKEIVTGQKQIELKEPGNRKSISTEYTFAQDTKNTYEINDMVEEMCEKIYPKIKNIYFKTISIKLRYNNFRTITRDYSFNNSINSLDRVKEICHILLNQNYRGNIPIRLIGVKISNFIENSNHQISLKEFLETSNYNEIKSF